MSAPIKSKYDYTKVFLNEEHFVPVDKIPAHSLSSAAIFKKFSNTPDALRHSPLKHRAEKLVEATKKWHCARDNETKDKIFAVLRTTLGVAIIAAGVFGLVAGATIAPPAVGIALVAGLSYALLTFYNILHTEIPLTLKGILTACALGPFLPVYEAFGNVSRLQEIRTNIKDSVENDFNELTRFFNAEHAQIEKKLTDEILKLTNSLAAVKRLPYRTRSGENELCMELFNHQRALTELQAAAKFYAEYS
ncbi:hypothetical protein [Parachlamydia acanthamoebae]|uniref:hypothetical protein n=1 Tax=Parachlamydia acanthamoebae TaxID=83552 RepID=UPI0024E21ACC|nr:hypothetical protein [Parachlamydia acanthamoebae]